MASPTPSSPAPPTIIGATFATLACTSPCDLRLPHALDVLLQPSTHLSALLQYIDLPTLAALRSLPLFRDRIAQLIQAQLANNSSSTGASIPRSAIFEQLRSASAPSEPDMFLRNCLTETKYLDIKEDSVADEVSDADGKQHASKLPKLMPKPKRQVWALSRVGLLALASSPLATELALQNLILLNVPGHDIDDKTKGLVYERIAKNETASAATLSLLIDHVKQLEINDFAPSSCKRVFHNVALNRNATSNVLAQILETTSDEHTHQSVAKHPNASHDVLSSIIMASYSYSRNGNPIVLRSAAANPNTSLSYLESFADDTNVDIRIAVASNPKAPPYLLSRLSMDKETLVRVNVARNISTPNEVLVRLCKDDDPPTRMAVARNISANNDVLALLSDNYQVLAWHSKDAGKLEFLSTVDDKNVQFGVARNLFAARETLARLAASEERHVRVAVAQNENTPASTLLLLSKDSNAHVRSIVALNPSTPSEALNSLTVTDADQHVVCHSIENPATDPEIVASYLTSMMSAVESNRRVYISRVHTPMLRALSHRDDVPTSVLALLSKSRFAEIRVTMAQNKRLPCSELSRLSKDPIELVSFSITSNSIVQAAADVLSCLLSPSGFSSENDNARLTSMVQNRKVAL